MPAKIIWIRFIAIIGLIVAITVGIVAQEIHTAMGYYFPQQSKFDYFWLVICAVLSLYFFLVIILGRFSLFQLHKNG